MGEKTISLLYCATHPSLLASLAHIAQAFSHRSTWMPASAHQQWGPSDYTSHTCHWWYNTPHILLVSCLGKGAYKRVPYQWSRTVRQLQALNAPGNKYYHTIMQSGQLQHRSVGVSRPIRGPNTRTLLPTRYIYDVVSRAIGRTSNYCPVNTKDENHCSSGLCCKPLSTHTP
jgi:hypothetical protein